MIAWAAAFWLAWTVPARAVILWSDLGSRVIHATPDGADILGGKVKRDDTASDALYFRFRVDPLSDPQDEPYYALFQLVETNQMRLGIGNALESWGYSAAYTSEIGPSNKVAGEFNLRSAHPEAAPMGVTMPYELPSHNHPRTIVFKVQYIPKGDDLVTVWLEPNLTHGATAENQPENITTKFKANASFDEIRLRHDGKGNGWIFSNMAIATSFEDFVVVHFWETWKFRALVAFGLVVWIFAAIRLFEQRRFRLQLSHAEQERALERERARIAQDLHDDLGSQLTRISLLGGLLKADKANPDLVEAHAGRISHSADQTVRALEEIVWALRPGSDTLQSLADYIAHFADELFQGDRLRCRLDLPADLPALALPPETRHNIFLIVKEALTNALKHSGAREARVQAKFEDGCLELMVRDDGRGFSPEEKAGKGNGLGNMRRRAEAIGGELSVTSENGNGTIVRLTVRLPVKTPVNGN